MTNKIQTILKSIYLVIYGGISSDTILGKVFFLLKKINYISASKPHLKSASNVKVPLYIYARINDRNFKLF
ncbi:MAG TPA: hypothetical protein VIN72_09800 [Lutibacter sp.]